MSEAQVVNMMLHRKLESGSQYSRLIPNYLSIRHSFELPADYSDTYDTLEFMAFWTEKYASQFQKVANVLKGKNVLETVQNNYNFLYKHFQYKIDENLQQIYAPSAAWHFRKVGFDCKTFSVLASALLLCQDIEHSFVKVKLPGSYDWSHVYVQIPYQGSYLIIDATTHDNKEVDFIEKHEFNMKNLKHIGLASPFMDTPYLNLESPSLACPGQACSCGSSGLSNPYEMPFYNNAALNSSTPTPELDYVSIISSLIKYLDLSSFSIGSLCIGGTSYDDARFKQNINSITNYFFNITKDYNLSITNKDYARTGQIIAEFIGKSEAMEKAFWSNRNADWNDCTDNNLVQTILFVRHGIRNILSTALLAHYNQFFRSLSTGVKYTFPTTLIVGDFFDGVELAHVKVHAPITPTPVDITMPTPKNENVILFELNDYLKNTFSTLKLPKRPSDPFSTTFTGQLYIESLYKTGTAVSLVKDSVSDVSGDSGTNTTGGTDLPPLPTKTKSTSNAGGFLIGALLFTGVVIGFSKMEDKGKGSQTAKKAPKK